MAALAARLGALLSEGDDGETALDSGVRELEALYERKLTLLATRLGECERERDDARLRVEFREVLTQSDERRVDDLRICVVERFFKHDAIR